MKKGRRKMAEENLHSQLFYFAGEESKEPFSFPLVGFEQENDPPSKIIPLSSSLQNKTKKINKVGRDWYSHFCEVTATIKREKRK
jgi:hypothetical protein